MSVNIEKGIKEMSQKLGKSEKDLTAEMAKFESDLSAIFDDTEEVKQAAFKQLRGAYRAQMKSNAKTFEGFFFAMQPVRNENDYPIKEADKEFNKTVEEEMAKIEKELTKAKTDKEVDEDAKKLMARERAVTKWQGLGKMNENQQYLFNADNTTDAMKWKRGKIIERYVPVRECYGFFKEPDVQGSKIRFGIVSVRHEPDKFIPQMLTVYSFRATGKPENSPLRLNGTAVTTLTETGVNIDFEVFVKMIGQDMPKNVKSFDDVYDLNKGICKVPENPRFFITKATISRLNVTDKPDLNIDFADITDLVGDFEPVSMTVSKDLGGIYENAIGIAVYAPYIKAKDQTPAGNLYGFVTADSAPKPATVAKKSGKASVKKNTDEDWE